MAGIPRKLQKVFGSSLVPAGNVAQWGSVVAGAPVYSSDPDTLQALAGFLSGLNGEVVGNRSPTMEELNGLFLLITQQIAYLLERGIPQWDVDTSYDLDGFCQVEGVVYVSLSDANLGNDPQSDTNNWQPYRDRIAPAKTTAKAWVNFDGTNGTILAGDNVSSVVRTAAGCYTISFTRNMADTSYAVTGTCGPGNGGDRSNPAGNNNHLCTDTLKSVSQVSVWLPKPDQLYGEDASLVSVLIFGN